MSYKKILLDTILKNQKNNNNNKNSKISKLQKTLKLKIFNSHILNFKFWVALTHLVFS